MGGDLYLGCGRAADEAELWRKMLHRPVTRIVYWPFALPAPLARAAGAWLHGNLDALGANYDLDVWQDLQQHRPDDLTIGRTDLLFVGGGNTFQLLDEVQQGGFVDAVKTSGTPAATTTEAALVRSSPARASPSPAATTRTRSG